MAERDYRLDNLRCLLIYLVVFCHLLVEVSSGPLTDVLYKVIYVFHMPAFVFVTGYFARFRPTRIVWGLAFPYVVFQLLATARRNLVAGRVWDAGLSFAQPQWTLWYLLACVLWYLTVPLLERITAMRSRGVAVAAAFAVSLVVGFVPVIGDYLDLSRVVVLFPFFCAGFYAGKMGLSQRLGVGQRGRMAGVLLMVVTGLMVWYFAHGPGPARLLYRNAPYTGWWDFETRFIAQLAACAWCALLLVMVPARKLGVVSMVGRNTISVYLLHPWFIRVLRLALPLPGGELAHLAACGVIAACMLVLAGNDWVGRAFRFVFCGGWLSKRLSAPMRS